MNENQFDEFLLSKLPIARIAGLKLKHYDNSKCQISVKYGFLNQNPFGSMFWAVQGMAAETSTGTLCLTKIKMLGENISMLVLNIQANFIKKAIGEIIFTCEEGDKIDKVLEKAIETGEGELLTLTSTGMDESGEKVAEFQITWSFKLKS